MHSSVFEISHTPIPTVEWARAGNLPDWFYEQVCDYAENTDKEQRQDAISQLCGILGSLCSLDRDRLTISPQIRETYFRKSYGCFIRLAERLAQTSYKTFSGCCTDQALSLVLDKLNDSYEDKRDIYIYLSKTGELMTLDRWLRIADFSKSFYIGGTINYHY